jgi:hypothetical protein
LAVEAEAEMDEFTAEPPPEGDKDDDLEGLEGDDAPSRMGECWRQVFESSLPCWVDYVVSYVW